MFTIYYDNRVQTIAFGAQKLKAALAARGVFVSERPVQEFVYDKTKPALVVRMTPRPGHLYKEIDFKHVLSAEGYEIVKDGATWLLNGMDATGTMYGLFDLAETVLNGGLDAIVEKHENPFHETRGIKLNLPYEPYDSGDPFTQNEETLLTQKYWRSLIDFLAYNRYNCLSLWSEHPFHMMFRLTKYPDTCPYSEEELHQYQSLYKFIFRYAAERGIKTYLITWNIRLTPAVAKGLGLPAELGDMFNRYDAIRDDTIHNPNPAAILDEVRQHLPIVQDYFKECIKTLACTYEDLCGIGTNASEEMVGSTEERVKWVEETYLKGIVESGRKLPFIFRTNLTSSQSIIDLFAGEYPAHCTLSWKYSCAHMYSSTAPQFEKLWKAWDDVNFGDVDIIYTVRNDDFHTFRGGSYDFLREYIKGMKKPNVRGYYWGADGYLWGKDFQHVPHKHMTWEYDFERHWYEFELLGRLGYNPDTPESIWQHTFARHYGAASEAFYAGFQAAGHILPPAQRLYWINYDFEWHPESLLSSMGFKTVRDFATGEAMPGVGTLSIPESAALILSGQSTELETCDMVLAELAAANEALGAQLAIIEAAFVSDGLSGEAECAYLDLQAWHALCDYYRYKIIGAKELCLLEGTADETHRDLAVAALTEGVAAWRTLSEVWASHYMPYKTARSKYYFGFGFYLDDVKRDVAFAKNYVIGEKIK